MCGYILTIYCQFQFSLAVFTRSSEICCQVQNYVSKFEKLGVCNLGKNAGRIEPSEQSGSLKTANDEFTKFL